jgi:outer membrane protein assembly factor BamD (BamD/ComL family)
MPGAEARGSLVPSSARSSTLAAEVALLDAVRAKIAAAAYDEALRGVEQFHRSFPAGELAPDADVLALEALAQKGDHSELDRRAARFLARYPADPHAARVRGLTEHAATMR